MESAVLLGEMTHFHPVTNHYRCSDGVWLLVTVMRMDSPPEPVGTLGVRPAVIRTEAATKAAVFLSDENAVVLDADGDPANGMTPLASYDDVASHAEVLARLGYTVES